MLRRQHNLFLSNSKQITAAVKLLKDTNLVWSADFEAVRSPLATWLQDEARKGNHASPYALQIAKNLLFDAEMWG